MLHFEIQPIVGMGTAGSVIFGFELEPTMIDLK